MIDSQVHRSLLDADNALGAQSNEHPDGWGVAFYVDGAPHVTRSPLTALGDQLFHRLSGVVSSKTVLAHVRKATRGAPTVLNCHPFQHGRWVFAHNGDIPNLEFHHEALRREIAPQLRRFVLGDTDSELVFHIILTELATQGPLSAHHPVDVVMDAVRRALLTVRQLCEDGAAAEPLLLTCILSDGDTLVGAQGGKELFVSTHKTRCADRETCPSLSAECEAPSHSGRVNHFILSSSPLLGENVWEPLAAGDLVGVDAGMRVHRTRLERRGLRVLSDADGALDGAGDANR